MIEKEAVVRTPVELQLQKMDIGKLHQFKNIQIEYHILRVLHEVLNKSMEIASTAIYHKIYQELLHFQELDFIKQLPLFEKYSYELWNNENLAIDIREKTNFYRIVSNWIINFQLRTGKLASIASQFQLIIAFMNKQTGSTIERLVMVQEIFEDLKELISEEFWQEEQDLKINAFSLGKFKNQLQPQPQAKEESCSQDELKTVEVIFQLLGAIINPLYYRVHQKFKLYRNCTYGRLKFPNVKQFIKKSIFFVLRQRTLPTHFQTELTKLSLIYLQFLNIEESKDILNLIKHLMIKTSKAVRFALVVEYVELYEYFEMMGFEDVIEQLQNIVYFRELIIDKKIVEESIMEMGNTLNDLSLSYKALYIKAGMSKKVYFSNERDDCVLKLDVIVEENDINMKIVYFDNLVVHSRPSNLSTFVFQTIHNINDYDGTVIKAQNVYWKQERATSKKLELKLQYQGLYCLELDNSYSWVVPKHIQYRLELYQPVQ